MFKETVSTEKDLQSQELQNAELLWIYWIQRDHFENEIKSLDLGKPIKDNCLLKLRPFLDNGLLRVGGKLHSSILSYEEKHPLVIPAKNPFTTLLVRDLHRITLHGDTQLTLASLRTKYWICKGSKTDRR